MKKVDPIVQKALAALDSFAVKLRNFIMLVRDPNVLACVFEGEDHLYYGPRIDSHIPSGKKRVNFPMHGKTNVLKLYDLRTTNADVRNAQSLYFIDRDFDKEQVVNKEKLYMTPCYSIENFYLSSNAIGRILRDCFKIEEYKVVFGKLMIDAEYIKVHNHIWNLIHELKFEYIVPLNAYILAGKEEILTDTTNEKKMFAYRDFTFDDYLDISLKKIKKKKEFNFINITQSLNASGIISEEKFIEKLNQLRLIQDLTFFRGKNNFEIFSSIMKTIFDDAGKSVPKIFDKRKDVKIAFDVKTAIGDLSLFADTPPCLQKFLASELSPI